MKNIRFLFSVPQYIWNEPSNKDQRLQRLITSIGWQFWKRTIRLPLILRLDNGLEFIAEPSSGNSTGAIYTRIYESQNISFARKYVQPGGILCDVGAHTGLYTLLLAPLFKQGICCEPADDTYGLLLRNLGLNRLHNFEVRKVAVSDTVGEVEFLYDASYSGTAHIIDGCESSSQGVVRKIPSLTLDSLLYENGVNHLTYLKIDTEGHEYSVLKGACKTLKINPQVLIHFECTKNSELIYEFFSELNFKVFGLDNKGNPNLFSSFEMVPQRGDLFACGSEHKIYNSLEHSID